MAGINNLNLKKIKHSLTYLKKGLKWQNCHVTTLPLFWARQAVRWGCTIKTPLLRAKVFLLIVALPNLKFLLWNGLLAFVHYNVT